MKHVLIVEDDEFLAAAYKTKLENAGFAVQLAANGKDGLDFLKENPTDVILLDLIMPEMDGFEMLAKLKENESWKSIPVVVSTNLGQPEDIKRAREFGVAEFIEKSKVSLQNIVDVLQKLVEDHEPTA